jgi:hypothetical protein
MGSNLETASVGLERAVVWPAANSCPLKLQRVWRMREQRIDLLLRLEIHEMKGEDHHHYYHHQHKTTTSTTTYPTARTW